MTEAVGGQSRGVSPVTAGVLRAVADGPVLVRCSGGRDRTGLVTAGLRSLLLAD